MMDYKGYIGDVKYDSDAHIFHGDVINTRDVITWAFHGDYIAHGCFVQEHSNNKKHEYHDIEI